MTANGRSDRAGCDSNEADSGWTQITMEAAHDAGSHASGDPFWIENCPLCPKPAPAYDLDALAMEPEDVAKLTRPERELRVARLVAEAHALVDLGIATHIPSDGPKRERRTCVAIVILFSGGNDSTVLAHLFKGRATHAAHANTGVGIEQTREYVRATCAKWDLPLLERKAPRVEDSYRAHVLEYGFPGPGAHYKMFQRLKERALDQVRRELVLRPYKERIVFLAGRRRTESTRRTNIPEMERNRSVVWISPLVNWTKPDMNTYRLMQADAGDPVPVNIVSDLVHMSGECLCGAFAHYGEREEISEWYADAFDEIAELEELIKDREDIKPWARKWGWSGNPALLAKSKEKPRSGPLCQSCDVRYEQAALALDDEDGEVAEAMRWGLDNGWIQEVVA